MLTEAQMKEYLGWVGDSRMASTYVHLSGRNIDDAQEGARRRERIPAMCVFPKFPIVFPREHI